MMNKTRQYIETKWNHIKVDWEEVNNLLQQKNIDIWKDEHNVFYRYVTPDGLDIIASSWIEGCIRCGRYKDIMKQLIWQQGEAKACKFALAYMDYNSSEGYICKECQTMALVERS